LASLEVGKCSHAAAKYAVEHWHNSHSMPVGKMVTIGAWEDKRFIGCVIFSRGACPWLGAEFGLTGQTEVCELTRVALDKHESKVTENLYKSIKILHQTNPGLQLIVSYADMNQNHLGKIYQANSWIYVGLTGVGSTTQFIINGEIVHNRTVSMLGWKANIKWLREHIDKNAQKLPNNGKHKYLYPLNKKMRKSIEKFRKPYPK